MYIWPITIALCCFMICLTAIACTFLYVITKDPEEVGEVLDPHPHTEENVIHLPDSA